MPKHYQTIVIDVSIYSCKAITRLYSVKIWFSKNAFFILCFTGRAFIMVKNNIKLVLEFQFDLKNPLKQPEMWIFEKWKIIVFGQNYAIFGGFQKKSFQKWLEPKTYCVCYPNTLLYMVLDHLWAKKCHNFGQKL